MLITLLAHIITVEKPKTLSVSMKRYPSTNLVKWNGWVCIEYWIMNNFFYLTKTTRILSWKFTKYGTISQRRLHNIHIFNAKQNIAHDFHWLFFQTKLYTYVGVNVMFRLKTKSVSLKQNYYSIIAFFL